VQRAPVNLIIAWTKLIHWPWYSLGQFSDSQADTSCAPFPSRYQYFTKALSAHFHFLLSSAGSRCSEIEMRGVRDD
jgi:hypothetical protein